GTRGGQSRRGWRRGPCETEVRSSGAQVYQTRASAGGGPEGSASVSASTPASVSASASASAPASTSASAPASTPASASAAGSRARSCAGSVSASGRSALGSGASSSGRASDGGSGRGHTAGGDRSPQPVSPAPPSRPSTIVTICSLGRSLGRSPGALARRSSTCSRLGSCREPRPLVVVAALRLLRVVGDVVVVVIGHEVGILLVAREVGILLVGGLGLVLRLLFLVLLGVARGDLLGLLVEGLRIGLQLLDV